MRIARLVWGMILRGLGWTAPLGALLGALYSLFVMGSLFFLNVGGGPGPSQSPPLAVFLSMGIILSVGGALVGGCIGLVFGPLGGLFCAVLTRFLSYPSPDARYPRLLRVIGAIYGALATVLGLWLISGFNISPPTGQAGNTLLFYILPAVIGLGAGFYIAQQIAGWYRDAAQSPLPPTGRVDAAPAAA